jgi:hypothetical protein
MVPTTICLPSHDEVARQVLRLFTGSVRCRHRPRRFSPSTLPCEGTVSYRGNRVPVRIVLDGTGGEMAADWSVVSISRSLLPPQMIGNRREFTSNPRTVQRILKVRSLPATRRHLVLFCNREPGDSRNGSQLLRAAHHLGAELSTWDIFHPALWQFPTATLSDRSFQQVYDWNAAGTPITLVSTLNLHWTEVSPETPEHPGELMSLLCRTVRTMFSRLSVVKEWRLYTYGPGDAYLLGWPEQSQQLSRLHRMRELNSYLAWHQGRISRVADRLTSALGFPVTVHSLSSLTLGNFGHMVPEIQDRSQQFLKNMLREGGLSSHCEWPDLRDWVFHGVLRGLLLANAYGQREGSVSPAVLSVGLEANDRVWQGGALQEGPCGKFLPHVWMPPAVRQPWLAGRYSGRHTGTEQMRLHSLLKYLEHSSSSG